MTTGLAAYSATARSSRAAPRAPFPATMKRAPGASKTVHDLPANRQVGSGSRRHVRNGQRVRSAAAGRDVERQRQEDRAGPGAGRCAVGLLRRTRRAGDAVHPGAPASHCPHDGDRVDAVRRSNLNRATRCRVRRDVAADEDQRQLFEERCGDSRERVGDSRTAGRQHERRNTRGHGVSDRAERGHRLVPCHHELDLGDFGERVEHGADEAPRDPECSANAARREDLKQARETLASRSPGSRVSRTILRCMTTSAIPRPRAKLATLQSTLEGALSGRAIALSKAERESTRGPAIRRFPPTSGPRLAARTTAAEEVRFNSEFAYLTKFDGSE